MKYAGIQKNDTTAAPGISLTFFAQGCPHRCEGCHNPETWDYEQGEVFTAETLNQILEGLTANGINRTFCIMGGEPLCEENLFLTSLLIKEVKERYPEQKIYIWTGYTHEELLSQNNLKINYILSTIDCLIDGPYIDELRDITLPMRGSSNQRVIYLKE